MLAVFEMRLELVEAQRCRAAEACIIARDLQFGQHVAHDAWHRPQVCQRHHGAVHRADLLLRKPLRDAGVTEGMLTVRGLRQTDGHIDQNAKSSYCSYTLQKEKRSHPIINFSHKT